jgi:hypothetical protein
LLHLDQVPAMNVLRGAVLAARADTTAAALVPAGIERQKAAALSKVVSVKSGPVDRMAGIEGRATEK